MKKSPHELAQLDALIEEITTDAYGGQEQLWAFRQAIEDNVAVPCDATIAGATVQVLKFDYDGNERRGLIAVCRGADGQKHVVAASDVIIPPAGQAGRYLAAYRKWMGFAPLLSRIRTTPRRKSKAEGTAVEERIELAVLSLKNTAARCRVLGTAETLTFRAKRLWDVVPGEIAVVRPAKRWTYAGNPYLSGKIESTRLDATLLGLAPLRLEKRGTWKPGEHYWGDEGDPIEEWAKPIIARGPRPQFEMEQILPGDVDDFDSDPIIEANDRKEAGDWHEAYRILMGLCQADLRCLDAHAHLGNLMFDSRPKDAIRHYEAGLRIGELSLKGGFDGLLPWGMIDNRPFLRCMHGFGICLWRLERFKEAADVFDRMLWLNPSDNQGVRFEIGEVRSKVPWHED